MSLNHKTLSVIIAAAGNSLRLGQEESKSKQFILLNGKPLLFYSIEKFLRLRNIIEIIIVTNNIEDTQNLVNEGKNSWNFENFKIVLGSDLRQDSVYNGFCNVNSSVDLVLIHDVARPIFKVSDVEKCIESALVYDAAILAVPLVDTLKKGRSDKDGLIVETTIDRHSLYQVQTPQVFKYGLLSEGYKMYKSSNLSNLVATDEAQVVELLGRKVGLVLGSQRNIKITYPEDLEIASSIVKSINNFDSKMLKDMKTKI